MCVRLDTQNGVSFNLNMNTSCAHFFTTYFVVLYIASKRKRMLSPVNIIDSGDTSPDVPTTPGGENSGKKKLNTLGFSNEP